MVFICLRSNNLFAGKRASTLTTLIVHQMNSTNEFLNSFLLTGLHEGSMLFNATEDESFKLSFYYYYIQRKRHINDQQFNKFLLFIIMRQREQSFKHFMYLRPSNIDNNSISIRTATGDCFEFCSSFVTFASNWIIFFTNENPRVKQYHISFYFRISYSQFSFKGMELNRSWK